MDPIQKMTGAIESHESGEYFSNKEVMRGVNHVTTHTRDEQHVRYSYYRLVQEKIEAGVRLKFEV
jgi:hypothetical protein